MVTKVSEITITDIQNYLRISEISDEDKKLLETMLKIAIDFIKNYTGTENIDAYSDFVLAVYVLCQDMYDTRTYYVDSNNVNKVVQTILDMHSTDLL